MEFRVKTVCGQKALTAMARALRKTLRRRRSLLVHLFGWTAAALGFLRAFAAWRSESGLEAGDCVTLLAALVIAAVSFTEDALNGWLAGRRQLPGTREAEAVFGSQEYACLTRPARTAWAYDQIVCVCETPDYFVFFLSKRHGQIFDKAGFIEGTPDAFREFIAGKTGKSVVYVK